MGTSYQSQLKRSHIFTNMYFILVIFVMTASLGQTASESKAKPKVKPETKDVSTKEGTVASVAPARVCDSPRLKDECEAGKIVVKTLVEKKDWGCAVACQATEECLTYMHTWDNDCALLKVKGKSSKEVGLPGRDYPLKPKPAPPTAPAAQRSRQKKTLTWEDCVEFHFDACAWGSSPTSGYETQHTNVPEENCLRTCKNMADSDPNFKCGSMITTVLGSDTRNCERATTRNVPQLTKDICDISRGMVLKAADQRDALEGCFGHNSEVKCKRGNCDLTRGLEQVYQSRTLLTKTELGCSQECWMHGNDITGDCTHYQWERKSTKCTFFKRKSTTTFNNQETNYKCQSYSLATVFTDRFKKKDLLACKSGGHKYYKATDKCEAMCKATSLQPDRIQFPIGVTIDTSSSQANDYQIFFKVMENLNKAPLYHLIEFGKNDTKDYPPRTNYAHFKQDLDTLVFNGSIPNRHELFLKGLKPLCERAAENSYLFATLDEYTNNLDLEAEIANCLIAKKATLFIALNPPFQNHTSSMEAYNRLAEGSGGKVVDISVNTDELMKAIDLSMDISCGCSLDRGFP